MILYHIVVILVVGVKGGTIGWLSEGGNDLTKQVRYCYPTKKDLTDS